MRKLWGRIVGWFRGLFGREPAPGYFMSGSASSWRGWHPTAPMHRPTREYLIYVPRGLSRWRRAPLMVLCHGCKQSPEDIAQGTRIAALADARGWLVLLPRQTDRANPWHCWNWFDARTAGGAGEAAIVAAQIKSVFRQFRIDRRRVVVAGMSAGGALAAVMGVRYPGLVRAVAVHSGIACGAAASPMSAIRVMSAGPDQDVAAIGDKARKLSPAGSLPVPLLAIHGGEDAVVSPRHATSLVLQYLRLNGHPAAMAVDGQAGLPPPDREEPAKLPDGRETLTREWRVGGALVARYVEVAGLAHAWTGGDTALPYNDALGPDATALVGQFFDEILEGKPA